MRFAQWPPRRIVLTWVLGLAAWGLLTAGAYLGSRDKRSAPLAQNGLLEEGAVSPANTLTTAGRDSFFALAFAALRLSGSTQDSIRAKALSLARDSSLTLTERRDSLSRLLNAPAQLSPVQRDSVKQFADSMFAPIVAGIAGGLTKAAPMIYLSIAIYFAIPFILVSMTLVWWLLRRRPTRPVDAAAA